MAMKRRFTIAEALQCLVADSDNKHFASDNSDCNSENEVDDKVEIG